MRKHFLTELTELRSKTGGPVMILTNYPKLTAKCQLARQGDRGSRGLSGTDIQCQLHPSTANIERSRGSTISVQTDLQRECGSLQRQRKMLPTSLLAGVMGYSPMAVFKASEKEAENPDINALFKSATS